MKTITSLLIALFMIANLMTSALAKSRVDNIASEDASERLARIEELQGYWSVAKKDLAVIEQTLAEASKEEKTEKSFVVIRNIAAAVTVLSFYNTVGAEVGVLLNSNEVKELREKTKELQIIISYRQTELQKEVKILCKEDQRHKRCY